MNVVDGFIKAEVVFAEIKFDHFQSIMVLVLQMKQQ